jgi:SAM-dependent methyltransferase
VDSSNEAVRSGHYAKKQIYSRDWLISWSHRQRFRVGLRVARQFEGNRILDYGCGDGTFLAMLARQSRALGRTVGCELKESVVADCRARLAEQDGLIFVTIDELDHPDHVEAYDLVICMEVLEHIVDVTPVLERFRRLVARGGAVLISVPVETGIPLIVKQIVRRIAGWRGLGDYPGTASYSVHELRVSLFAGRRARVVRPVYKDESGMPFHDHKGFNWAVLRDQIGRRFDIVRTFSAPFEWLPPQFATHVWFLARPRGLGTSAPAGNAPILT